MPQLADQALRRRDVGAARVELRWIPCAASPR